MKTDRWTNETERQTDEQMDGQPGRRTVARKDIKADQQIDNEPMKVSRLTIKYLSYGVNNVQVFCFLNL